MRQLSPAHFSTQRLVTAAVPLPLRLQAEVDPETYLPPPLRKGAVGWYPEWGKVGGWVASCGGDGLVVETGW